MRDLLDVQTCVALLGLALFAGGVAVKFDAAWAAIIVGTLLLAMMVWPYLHPSRSAETGQRAPVRRDGAR